MARIRTIKPDFFADEKISKLRRDVRLLFIGLWVFSDDYGTVRSNPVWIKSNVFPYDEELRVNDVKTWLDALVKARMLEPFEYNGEGFYNIRTFCSHQRVEKPSRPIIPIVEKQKIIEESESSRVVVGEYSPPEVVSSNGKEVVSSNGRANALFAASPDISANLQIEYKKLIDSLSGKDLKEIWVAVRDFIILNKPGFIDPYVDAWNVFGPKLGLSKVDSISDSRRKKFRTRIKDESFDFIKILEKIKCSAHLKGDNERGWKVTFDWVFENDKNFIKITEGNYN
jgi:hypothetical protein